MKTIRLMAAVTVLSMWVLMSGKGVAEVGSAAPPPPAPTSNQVTHPPTSGR